MCHFCQEFLARDTLENRAQMTDNVCFVRVCKNDQTFQVKPLLDRGRLLVRCERHNGDRPRLSDRGEPWFGSLSDLPELIGHKLRN